MGVFLSFMSGNMMVLDVTHSFPPSYEYDNKGHLGVGSALYELYCKGDK